MVRLAIYRLLGYLRHRLTSWNTSGEGIHSPSLFYMVRMLFYCNSRYYCWSEIENIRQQMFRSDNTIFVRDFGTGEDGVRRVADIARTSLERPQLGQLLFRLLVYMGQQNARPLAILELGTSLGITTSYLAMANRENQVVTMEGSSEIARIARGNWEQLRVKNVTLVEGNIDDTLTRALDTLFNRAHTRCIDLAYVDANHTYEATCRYASLLLPLLAENGVLVVDDIHYSPEMESAWNTIKEMGKVTSTMDFYHFGIAFANPYYLKKHYRLKI